MAPEEDWIPEQWMEYARSCGFDVISQDEDDPWFVWVQVRPSVSALRDLRAVMKAPRRYGRAPALKFENMVGGKFRYNTHGRPSDREDVVIEDYADPIGREAWKDYQVIQDRSGRIVAEGPKPFRNAAERREYEQLTGQRHREPGEHRYDPRKRSS